MSELRVEVKRITDIKPHNNADKLEIAIIDGWQTVIQKDRFKINDKVIYLPLDAVLPDKMIDYFNLEFVRNTKNRIRAIKLRKEVSYGLILPLQKVEEYLNQEIKENQNIADLLEIKKYVEPEKYVSTGKQKKQTKWVEFKKYICKKLNKNGIDFIKYFDIENLRNNTSRHYDKNVIISEKIHGMNARFALIKSYNPYDNLWTIIKNLFTGKMSYFVGSHNTQRDINDNSEWSKYFRNNPYIQKTLLRIALLTKAKRVIIFGELFGKGVQDLEYSKNKVDFVCFDLLVDNKFYSLRDIEQRFYLPIPPILYEGKYDFEIIKSLEGLSKIDDKTIMEGVIIKDKEIVYNPRTSKYVFDQYLTRQKGTEYK